MNKKSLAFNRVIAITAASLLLVSLSTLAVAQRVSAEERNAIFAGASRVQTSVKGVTAFAGPPSGFDPLTATNRELLTYGLPERPDPTTDAKAYEHWQRGMSALQACNQNAQTQGRSTSTSAQSCHATDVTAKPYTSHTMMSSGVATPNVDGTTASNSLNWSGIINTNKNKTWNNKTSFTQVESVWNVPVSNHPFGNVPCADGPWFNVTWNGIDGANNGVLVQAGSANFWDGGGCGGAVETYGWFEWVPSYPILAINAFVSPGDDFWVITYAAAGTVEQFAFVEDITQQWSGTFGMTYVKGPGVIGASAEYIVERPCCLGNGDFYPLGNYVYEFLDFSFAFDGAGTQFFPGSASAATDIVTMQADSAANFQAISRPFYYGTGGNQGKYSIWFADENCANTGACTP